jgi:acyl-CoA synthetase (AMP-forming)/AMP-acid ligase II
MGSRDPAGFLTLVGRKHDLIITSGFNVYPQLVELAINECPGVKESAVVGIPDRKRGERVVAAIVPDDNTLTEAALKTYLAQRLVDYQRPAQIILLPALPRNAMGKVLRRELRDELADRTPMTGNEKLKTDN